MDELYSLENAQKFNWSSVTGNLNPERVSHLETYLVGKKILDAGCAGGAYVEFLAQKGLEVTGVEKYEQFLQVARQDRRGAYVQGDLTNLPFPDKTFDCTYCFDVLEHVDDQLAIQELARVTTRRLIIAVPKEDEIMNNFNLTYLHYQDKTHLRNYTEMSLKELFSKINYSNLVIFSELAVPTKYLVQEMIVLKGETIKNSMKNLVHQMIDRKFNNSTYKYFGRKSSSFLINILLNKAVWGKVDKELVNKLLETASYKEIYTGLVAVVDLECLSY